MAARTAKRAAPRRLLYSMAEAAAMLDMSTKTLHASEVAADV